MKNYIVDDNFLVKNNINKKDLVEVLFFITLEEIKKKVNKEKKEKNFSDDDVENITSNVFESLQGNEEAYSEFLENFRYEIPFELNAHKKNKKKNRFYLATKEFLKKTGFNNFNSIKDQEATSYLVTKDDLKNMILETYDSNDIKFTSQKLNKITSKSLDSMFNISASIKESVLIVHIDDEMENYEKGEI